MKAQEKINCLLKTCEQQITIHPCKEAMDKAINGLKKEREIAVKTVYYHGKAQGLLEALNFIKNNGGGNERNSKDSE